MFIPFFCCYAKRFRTIFVSLHPLKEFRSKIQKKSYTEMNLNMHITSQSFVQSYRRFERNSYVHTSSTSDTAGIGFPHHYSHSYFYRASQQRAPQRIKIIRKSWSFLAGRIQLFLFQPNAWLQLCHGEKKLDEIQQFFTLKMKELCQQIRMP